VVRSVEGALIGGTISAATGGKFANGAISGAVEGAMEEPARSDSSESDGDARTGTGVGNIVDPKLAQMATDEANSALAKAGILDRENNTIDDGAKAWGR